MIRLLLALVLAAATASCSYVEATTRQYSGVERFPPVEADSVRVLPGEPNERHDRLGEVLLDLSVDSPPPLAEVEERLREEAAKLGADAVYILRESRTSSEHKIVALAIRFRR
jgi:hypothetical protein